MSTSKSNKGKKVVHNVRTTNDEHKAKLLAYRAQLEEGHDPMNEAKEYKRRYLDTLNKPVACSFEMKQKTVSEKQDNINELLLVCIKQANGIHRNIHSTFKGSEPPPIRLAGGETRGMHHWLDEATSGLRTISTILNNTDTVLNENL